MAEIDCRRAGPACVLLQLLLPGVLVLVLPELGLGPGLALLETLQPVVLRHQGVPGHAGAVALLPPHTTQSGTAGQRGQHTAAATTSLPTHLYICPEDNLCLL